MSAYDPTDLIGQERDRAVRDARVRAERDVEEGDVRWLMSSKRGRRIVWKLMDSAGVNRSCFDTNALKMAFNEGNRNYGNLLQAQIYALCPELYVVMVKEHRDYLKERNGAGTGEQSH